VRQYREETEKMRRQIEQLKTTYDEALSCYVARFTDGDPGIVVCGQKRVAVPTGFSQILEKSGKSWNLKSKFSRSGISEKSSLGMEK